MKIGILGSGDVAKALAVGFLERGDAVMCGTRDPAKLTSWLADRPQAKAGTFRDAASFGELIVLATLGTATVDVVESQGEAAFAGKVVIDATNPLVDGDSGPQLAFGFDDSLGERIQQAIPNARVVKAFNTVGAPLMVHPILSDGPPSMFVAGNDDAAKKTVGDILHDFGWDVVDLGAIKSSRYLEPMCMAWLAYGLRNDAWNHAFKLLR